MGNYFDLIAAINAAIKTNGEQGITGASLNAILRDMVAALGAGYQYVGVVTPDAAAPSTDYNAVYLGLTAGTYTNFGGTQVRGGQFGVFTFNGSWTYNVADIASGGYVRYDVPQVMTQEQAAQARSNIAAASNADVNTKYTKPDSGIPATDLAEAVQTSLGKADAALPASSVVDNLSTEDATKALSAKQGKVLDNEVNQLGQEVNEFFEYSAAPSDVTWIRGKYISLTGELADSQYYGYTSPVPIKKGEVAVVYVGSYLFAAISKTDSAGSSYVPVVTVETSPGPSSQLFRYEYLADEDGYIAFSGYWGNGFYGFVAKADMIFALKQDVEGAVKYDSVQTLSTAKKTQARENIDAAGEDDVNFKLTADVNATIGFQNWAYGYVKPNGTIQEASSGSWRYSDKIPIVPDSPIVVNRLYCNTAVASVASYDSDDNLISECTLSQSTSVVPANPVTIPTLGKNVAYIRITAGGGYTSYDVTVTQYSGTKSVKEAIIDVQEQLDNISIGTQWAGKSWVALGTSITDTKNTLAPDGTSTGKFVPFLVALSGLVVVDKGVAGAVIGGHILYYAGHSTETANADIVTIEGGVNDWAGNRPLGQVGDTVPYLIEWTSPAWNNGGSAEGTFAGACYQAIKTAMDNSPKAVVVVITDNTGQHLLGTGADCSREKTNSLGLRQKDYTDMLIAVANYMGVPVINAGQRSMINQDNPEYLIDQIHQTELGGEQFANVIWSDLKNFPCRITE